MLYCYLYYSGANGKAEWKRYKQYTKDDVAAAIEEVKAGIIQHF